MKRAVIGVAVAVILAAVPAAATNGGHGNDSITGGPGNDLLLGGRGADIIHSGKGSDYVNGGPGPDICYTQPRDTVLDCEVVR